MDYKWGQKRKTTERFLSNFRENSWPFAQFVVCICVGKVQGVWHLPELHFFVHFFVLSHLETRKLGDIFTTGNPFCKWTKQLLSGKYNWILCTHSYTFLFREPRSLLKSGQWRLFEVSQVAYWIEKTSQGTFTIRDDIFPCFKTMFLIEDSHSSFPPLPLVLAEHMGITKTWRSSGGEALIVA